MLREMRSCHWRAAAALLFLLSGCALPGRESSAFVTQQIEAAYIPLYKLNFAGGQQAAAVAIAPHLAVTNDHNYGLIPKEEILARSRDFDLLFFRTDRNFAPPIASPRIGEEVVAYGQHGRFGRTERREADGIIRELDFGLPAHCTDCAPQKAISYDADAGTGFSGGPVVDAKSGALVGVTVAFADGKGERGGRRMYAFNIDLVIAEMHRLLDEKAR